ncbi:hypothetical protein B0J15DRAFT_516443 [Fusarium solani]|uniref:Calpain catalytic domain-containing protein n=1 Tax=Fusarium solani TaxID=169388 RepID=A0A9P9GE28_FUSSL|nr:uncharacterized protein B0J15DRAFT_516443 [Fusarium solani]KAH7237835.1 hypothetical protein B0J15DRAFT_516443 [Fusarium solani]
MHSHSSSSESDGSGRPRKQSTVTITRNNGRKKRRRDFRLRTPSTAPGMDFSAATLENPCRPPLDPSRSLLLDPYERTAEKCRRIVQNQAEECKRVGMRYEDHDWDLDRDLKQKKGHCLNSLGSQRFKLDKDTLLSPSALTPRSVKRVHEIFDNPTFMKNVNGGDVQQGALGNCWFTGALTALGNVPDELKRICVAYDTEVGIYAFVFFRDGEWIQTIIDDKLYLNREDNEEVYRNTYQTGSKALFFAQCRDQNETWVPLVEKAYAKAHGDYASLSGGWMSEANDEFLFGASTGYLGRNYVRPDGISEGHCYVVMDARMLESGERLVKLRDPRGKVGEGTWKGPWSDGFKEWTTQANKELGHTFGSDSVFWVSYEDFMKKFTHLDCMRRFRGLDWRCCQRWIAVDIPWKAEYYKKFQFNLTKNSPLCLVLSQLDRRYYVGLWGQYSFHLDFRLHKEDSPDAEDYVARPHGHYVMDRSVSVDLAELPAGNYVVHLKVTCERDVNAYSVEEVVEHECRNRVENKKFAQASECRQKRRRLDGICADQRRASKRERSRGQGREAWSRADRLGEEYNAEAEAKVSEAVERLTASLGAKHSMALRPSLVPTRMFWIPLRTQDPESPKAETAGAVSISPGSPHLTPKSVESEDGAARNKQEVRPIDGATPALFEEKEPCLPDDDETEEEGAPDPWNAVCVVGIRVYSEDSGLELHTMMEGDEFLERHENVPLNLTTGAQRQGVQGEV